MIPPKPLGSYPFARGLKDPVKGQLNRGCGPCLWILFQASEKPWPLGRLGNTDSRAHSALEAPIRVNRGWGPRPLGLDFLSGKNLVAPSGIP